MQGCATGSSISSARNQFYSGQPQAALETLESSSVSNRDRLLAHLDRGLIAHTAGEYTKSIIAFKAATALLNDKDFISVKEQTASLITNDWATTYKGEYSERLWIHTFQMMNFLLLQNPEAAAVEARQALQIYDQHGDSLKKDWYSRTLIAMSFEAAGKPDSAHIEYKKLLDSIGSDAGMARRAWLNAMRLGREQDAKKFKSFVRSDGKSGQNGELVLFLQTGAIPSKIAGEIFVDPELYASFPVYPNIPRPDVSVTVSKNGTALSADLVKTQLVDVSRSALAARGKQITTKQILRIAAKKELSRALEKRADGYGGLITAAFFLLEQADTRSWQTLPAHTTLVQVPLSAGTHSLQMQIKDGSSVYNVDLQNINIVPQRPTFRSLRVGAGAPKVISPELPVTESP